MGFSETFNARYTQGSATQSDEDESRGPQMRLRDFPPVVQRGREDQSPSAEKVSLERVVAEFASDPDGVDEVFRDLERLADTGDPDEAFAQLTAVVEVANYTNLMLANSSTAPSASLRKKLQPTRIRQRLSMLIAKYDKVMNAIARALSAPSYSIGVSIPGGISLGLSFAVTP